MDSATVQDICYKIKKMNLKICLRFYKKLKKSLMSGQKSLINEKFY
ncbi:hypothetical protein P344_04060 [Spiroplasma mirum ATCC 29335]|uniref:Uncharacterized protein n=1 Tax=Spiroplasma mirum ATCC 29335 TaxID=838561 RepID=W6AN42_9MOLU|nr:hypothetical protein P344_04060 [Spiroplasma mirum ATCC 29335]AKM53192.1 hypothetical protein SATRI_v1c07400 [Spiroplasma atrichopogonis]